MPQADVKRLAANGSLNRGNVRLVGKTGGDVARVRTASGADWFGLRARWRSSRITCVAATELLPPNQLPQSSRVLLYCAWPLVSSISPVSGLMRKSRPRISSVLPVFADFTTPPLSPLAQ